MRRYTVRVQDKEYIIDVDDLEANRFRVILNNQAYEVNLSAAQDLAEASISPAIVPERGHSRDEVVIERPTESYTPPDPAVMERTKNVPSPALPPAPVAANGARNDLIAPMPGTILAVDVKPGDRVTHGQKLMTLEAMKMKNAIKSPRDGVIGKVLVEAGQTVRYGDALICFEESAA